MSQVLIPLIASNTRHVNCEHCTPKRPWINDFHPWFQQRVAAYANVMSPVVVYLQRSHVFI